MKQAITSIILLLSLLSFIETGMAKAIDEHIYIVPAGEVDKNAVEYIKNGFPGSMPMSVRMEIDHREDVPQAAYDLTRKQYNADAMLSEIYKHMTIDTITERVLVVTDVDLYMPGSDFVLGLANAKKGICIVSLARFKQNNKIFLERVLKQAIYEFGVSRGLNDCSDPKCVMYYKNTPANMGKNRNSFCHDCRNKLSRQYGNSLFGDPLKSLL